MSKFVLDMVLPVSTLRLESKVQAGMGHHAAAPHWRVAPLPLGVVRNKLAESPHKVRNLLFDGFID